MVFSESMKVNDKIATYDIANLSSGNYTNILKSVTENLDDYIGEKIHFVGYVFRAMDFTKDEFVLARDMVISPDNQTLVVGFLCKYKNAEKFKDKTWIEITGTIQKGEYHSEIPIIQIENIKEVEQPSDEFVYPPDDYYIPTSILF